MVPFLSPSPFPFLLMTPSFACTARLPRISFFFQYSISHYASKVILPVCREITCNATLANVAFSLFRSFSPLHKLSFGSLSFATTQWTTSRRDLGPVIFLTPTRYQLFSTERPSPSYPFFSPVGTAPNPPISFERAYQRDVNQRSTSLRR